MTTRPQAIDETISAGQRALAAGEWERAKGLFEAALEREDSPQIWEGLGWAGWWLSDQELTIRAREQAYRGYRRTGDARSAGRVAAWLAADFREFRGEAAVGSGWLEQAHRLLDELPESPDHGWLALIDADFVLNLEHDPDAVIALASAAGAIGRRFGVADLEALGLALEGVALVSAGRVADGMRRLDHASTIARGEDLHLPLSQGWVLCCLVSACEDVGDFPRATQWCAAMRDLADRWGGRQLLGLCRSSYGRVLAKSGDWSGAESELVSAVRDLEVSRPGLAAGGLIRLGELRARQGRTDEARELFERAGPRGLVGLGDLALDAGEPSAAADSAERVLRRLPETAALDRLPALELVIRARAALGELDAAERAAAELEATGERLTTPYVRARVRLARGRLEAAAGRLEEARRACEDALDLFTEASAPYDAAVARLELGRALAALGHDDRAALETSAAEEVFAQLGAARDGERARGRLAEGGHLPASAGTLSELTARELEVLRLVAKGRSDAEIADELVLSPHTVHRHVANVRVKLGLPSRAAAVAYAARAGLL